MKKPSMISILLFLTGLLCIIALIFFNRTTLHQILTTEKEVDTISEQITAKHDEVKQAVGQVHYRHRHSPVKYQSHETKTTDSHTEENQRKS